MSEKTKFVARLLNGERMTDLCMEFSISRKTGYKIYNRYLDEGIGGLYEKLRSPINRPNQTKAKAVKKILEIKDIHKTWGAPKIRSYLQNKNVPFKIPASSTIHSILEKNNLVKKKRRNKHYKSQGTNLTQAKLPNDLWCVDFKGQFRMKNKKYCYPLTITDQISRYLISCDVCESTKEDESFLVFEEAFQEYGLPKVIRSDNGVPFASRSYYGLSKLSLWWIYLGIKIERIKPGNPQENGQHERMHRTLKEDSIKQNLGKNTLHQQEIFDAYKKVFNYERPHSGINSVPPSVIYKKSKRTLQNINCEFEYSGFDLVLRVSKCGSIIQNSNRIYIGPVFSGHELGLKAIDDDLFEIYFGTIKMGYCDFESKNLEPIKDAFIESRKTNALPSC